MIGKRTWWTKKEIKAEILGRMNAGLDTSNEEYSNEDLMKDFIDLSKPRRDPKLRSKE